MSGNTQKILQDTERFVKGITTKEGSHDWFHICRVRQLAIKIAEKEAADRFVVELAALLHELDDFKLYDDDTAVRQARALLTSLQVDQEVLDQVFSIIKDVSYKGAEVDTTMPTSEGKCVQDGDRLDALGAVGIARAFAYGGRKGRPLYDPAIVPEFHKDYESYKKNDSTSVNHFHEKLLLLKDRMQTNTGQQLAEERHQFVENFLQQFMAEWEQ